jgi:mono/diheme cytochrome c family protein
VNCCPDRNIVMTTDPLRGENWCASIVVQRVFAILCLTLLVGCDRLDMYDQPRYEPLEASNFFGDGLSARPPVDGTVARGSLREEVPYFTGKDSGKPIAAIPTRTYRAMYDRNPQRFDQPFDDIEPVHLRHALLERGRERFDIYCSVCHGRTGDGDGMIVRRPPSFHIDRLRNAASGHFFDVITNGFGSMASYANRVDVEDRWAIVAYLRALQLSQNASFEDVPAESRDELKMQGMTDDVQIDSREKVR